MQCISAKFVFCILTFEQKEHFLSVIANLLQETEMDQTSWKASSWVMRNRFMDMIQKRNISLNTGSRLSLQD